MTCGARLTVKRRARKAVDHSCYGGGKGAVAAAQRAHADCLVTNDQNLLKHSPVAALSCTDALAYLQALE